MLRTTKVPTPKLNNATRREKGKGKVESPVKDAPTSNEVWMKVLIIEDKIDDVTSTLGKVATTVQMLTLHKTCFVHMSIHGKKSSLAAMSRVSTVSFPEFPEFPPIIRNYDFSSDTTTK
ncbi:hypothetical protein V6N13_074390 [Hibiscus sabdariffa]|uniref:Uncharacterized protein n=1 Tax=Hibiscus sabdariffa TaxID=183260 RepID=A0ABR2U887_9ROSI